MTEVQTLSQWNELQHRLSLSKFHENECFGSKYGERTEDHTHVMVRKDL